MTSLGTSGSAQAKYKSHKGMIALLGGVLLVFAVVFFMKWFGNMQMAKFLDNMPTPPATISVAEVATMRWDKSLEAIGSLVPVNGAELTTESGGIVTALHFESGAHVEAGTLLVTLDSANERGDLKRLQAQAELAELNRKRREQLYKLEAISKSDYDAVKAEANAAKAAVDAQAGKLALKEIRAPFAGQLGIRQVNVGQYVSPGTPLVSLQSLDPVDVDFSLPEQYTGAVKPGYTVSVKVDAQPDRAFNGEVLAIEPRVTTATRNFSVRARLPNPEGLLRAGQFGRVVLDLPGEQEMLVVPRTSINYASYGASVFVVRDRQPVEGKPLQEGEPKLEVVQKFVKIGEGRGDFVAVLEGLVAGDRVATSGLVKLRNNQPIIINNDLAPDAQLDPETPQT
ncbi:MAG: efflux RND transporter periplasmic adaptor subunit [Pseudomonadota bacterium]|nr:efflux RND transporter periplasmic adaptor subunit [Pseudomonadota bacterium]